jgi:hypothetical protein
MEAQRNLKLLELHLDILYIRYHISKRDFANAKKLLDNAMILLQELITDASAKEKMFYQIIKIGLNNVDQCIDKKLRMMGMIELCHISDISLIFLIKDYEKEQEDYYWNVIKTEYENHSKKEFNSCFKRVWDNLIQQKY